MWVKIDTHRVCLEMTKETADENYIFTFSFLLSLHFTSLRTSWNKYTQKKMFIKITVVKDPRRIRLFFSRMEEKMK